MIKRKTEGSTTSRKAAPDQDGEVTASCEVDDVAMQLINDRRRSTGASPAKMKASKHGRSKSVCPGQASGQLILDCNNAATKPRRPKNDKFKEKSWSDSPPCNNNVLSQETMVGVADGTSLKPPLSTTKKMRRSTSEDGTASTKAAAFKAPCLARIVEAESPANVFISMKNKMRRSVSEEGAAASKESNVASPPLASITEAEPRISCDKKPRMFVVPKTLRLHTQQVGQDLMFPAKIIAHRRSHSVVTDAVDGRVETDRLKASASTSTKKPLLCFLKSPPRRIFSDELARSLDGEEKGGIDAQEEDFLFPTIDSIGSPSRDSSSRAMLSRLMKISPFTFSNRVKAK